MRSVPPLDAPAPVASHGLHDAADPRAVFAPSADRPAHGDVPWLVEGKTCWRREHAHRLSLLVDGEAFFSAVRSALANARHSFYILGWDINSEVRLCPGGADDGLPEPLGDFLNALVERRTSLHGHVLGWDYAMLYAFEREWWSKSRFARHRRLSFALDAQHPLGASHHQKVIVVDDRIAFVSGFDLAPCRWDTSDHDCEHPLRTCGDKPYGPFHDVGLLVEGDCAAALGELCRERWQRGTGQAGHPAIAATDEPSPWPAQVETGITDVEVAISRTGPAWGNAPAVTEIRDLYLEAMSRARDFVFAENQYFTSNIVARVMAQRLAAPEAPEFVLLVPTNESGWIETSTMGVLRARVHAKLRAADRASRYALYCPRHACDAARDVCINVHSKVLVVDDELLTIGSANLSDRSMCYDTECNLALEAKGDPRVRAFIAGVRARLLGEHLGIAPDDVLAATAQGESLHDAIRTLSDPQRRHLDVIEPRLDPALDNVLPGHDVVDPAEPLDAEVLIADVLPRPRGRRSVRTRVAVGVAALLAVCAAVLAWRHFVPSTPEAVVEITTFSRQWQDSPWLAVGFFLAYVAGGFVLVPLTLLIATTAALFGPLVAIPLALAGALASGASTFALSRRVERGWLRRYTGRGFETLTRRLERRGLLAVLIVRLLPIAPYTVVNVAAGVARIGWRDFLLGTTLGLLPGIVLTSALVDRALAVLTEPTAWRMVALCVVAAIIAAMAFVLHKKFDRGLAT